jgi:DNA-binding PadR family transcriptional regulator
MPSADKDRRGARTTTSFAILGLLAVRDWTTYELAKQVRRSLNWFWPRAERKLYDEPKALVADGLATAHRQHTGQRPRTVYSITDAGRRALRDWLDLPPAPRATEFEAMLKVFFADAGSLDQLTTTIERVGADAVDRLGQLGTMAAQVEAGNTQFPERHHISALALRLQLVQEQAVLTWARWAREQVREWRSTTDAGSWDHRRELGDIAEQANDLAGTRGRTGA